AVDAAPDLLGEFALQQMRDAAGELDDLDAARDLALRIGEDFAVLFGDDPRQRIVLPREDFEKLEQDPRARQRRGRRPAGKRRGQEILQKHKSPCPALCRVSTSLVLDGAVRARRGWPGQARPRGTLGERLEARTRARPNRPTGGPRQKRLRDRSNRTAGT